MTMKSLAERKNEMAAYTEQIAESVKELRTSEGYARVLKCMASFHDYSFNNVMMILMQMPEATRVAGFNTWKKNNRFVKKGEHGIRIFAPIVRKERIEAAHGEEKETRKVCGYKLVSVFDLSQTEGESLPEFPALPVLEGTVDGFEDVMAGLRGVTDYEVQYGVLEEGTYGLCSHVNKTITLTEGLSEACQIRTLVHEVAHSLLHGKSCGLETSAKEIEAESVAYMVCAHFGIDTSDSSFAYLAGWSASMDDAAFTSRLVDLQKTASKIIGGVEAGLEGAKPNAA